MPGRLTAAHSPAFPILMRRRAGEVRSLAESCPLPPQPRSLVKPSQCPCGPPPCCSCLWMSCPSPEIRQAGRRIAARALRLRNSEARERCKKSASSFLQTWLSGQDTFSRIHRSLGNQSLGGRGDVFRSCAFLGSFPFVGEC